MITHLFNSTSKPHTYGIFKPTTWAVYRRSCISAIKRGQHIAYPRSPQVTQRPAGFLYLSMEMVKVGGVSCFPRFQKWRVGNRGAQPVSEAGPPSLSAHRRNRRTGPPAGWPAPWPGRPWPPPHRCPPGHPPGRGHRCCPRLRWCGPAG